MFLKAETKDFCFSPLLVQSLSWTPTWLSTGVEQGTVLDVLPPSYSSAQCIQVFGNEKQTTCHSKLPPSSKNKTILLSCTAL